MPERSSARVSPPPPSGSTAISPELATQFLDVAFTDANLADRFLLSSWGTLSARLRPLLTETVIRSLAGADFAPSDLMTGERPVSVYLRWPERDLLALSPLVRLLWGSLIDELVAAYDRRAGQRLQAGSASDRRGRPNRDPEPCRSRHNRRRPGDIPLDRGPVALPAGCRLRPHPRPGAARQHGEPDLLPPLQPRDGQLPRAHARQNLRVRPLPDRAGRGEASPKASRNKACRF